MAGVVNALQINPIDGDRPDPKSDVARAVRGNYDAVVLDMESGPGGNGFDPFLHVEYYKQCNQASLPFIGAPKASLSHFMAKKSHSRLGWTYERTVDHLKKTTDGLILWNYSGSLNQWKDDLDRIYQAGYMKPIWAMSADGNNRPEMTTPEGNMRILTYLASNTHSSRWGIFFPHKMPALTRQYAQVANQVFA